MDNLENRKSATRKIAEPQQAKFVCKDIQHNPPTHIVYSPGTYEHRCPKCHRIIVFTVPEIAM